MANETTFYANESRVGNTSESNTSWCDARTLARRAIEREIERRASAANVGNVASAISFAHATFSSVTREAIVRVATLAYANLVLARALTPSVRLSEILHDELESLDRIAPHATTYLHEYAFTNV